ncbi:hypothetical protein BRAS3809_3330001 [Bradyrhizobium sp. STM 3809]|nr:hypothetical protein BRAS3809_3330001 [Bradyrhizobium sp. STM 3809]
MNLSHWGPEHNRSGPPDLSFTALPCGLVPVVLALCSNYLGMRPPPRNRLRG